MSKFQKYLDILTILENKVNPKCPDCKKELTRIGNAGNYFCKTEDCTKLDHYFNPRELKDFYKKFPKMNPDT